MCVVGMRDDIARFSFVQKPPPHPRSDRWVSSGLVRVGAPFGVSFCAASANLQSLGASFAPVCCSTRPTFNLFLCKDRGSFWDDSGWSDTIVFLLGLKLAIPRPTDALAMSAAREHTTVRERWLARLDLVKFSPMCCIGLCRKLSCL